MVCSHFSPLLWAAGQARAFTEGAGQPSVLRAPATPHGALGEEHLSHRPRHDRGRVAWKGCAGLPGSQPSCGKKKTIGWTWARNEDASSPPRSLSDSFSLPLNERRCKSLMSTMQALPSHYRKHKVQEATVPSLCSSPLATSLLCIHSWTCCPSAWNLLPPRHPRSPPALRPIFAQLSPSFLSPNLNLQPPHSNPGVPATAATTHTPQRFS